MFLYPFHASLWSCVSKQRGSMIDLFSSTLYPLCTHTPHPPGSLISRQTSFYATLSLCLITNWAVTAF